jgi:hypothetical protein
VSTGRGGMSMYFAIPFTIPMLLLLLLLPVCE